MSYKLSSSMVVSTALAALLSTVSLAAHASVTPTAPVWCLTKAINRSA